MNWCKVLEKKYPKTHLSHKRNNCLACMLNWKNLTRIYKIIEVTIFAPIVHLGLCTSLHKIGKFKCRSINIMNLRIQNVIQNFFVPIVHPFTQWENFSVGMIFFLVYTPVIFGCSCRWCWHFLQYFRFRRRIRCWLWIQLI